jgi:hypothetical protein
MVSMEVTTIHCSGLSPGDLENLIISSCRLLGVVVLGPDPAAFDPVHKSDLNMITLLE